MTATNHVSMGALIAVAIPNPALALPMALSSHFLLDLLPHYGLSYIPEHERDKSQFFRRFVTVDTLLALGLFAALPELLRHHVNPAEVIWCMFLAQVPDAVWLMRHAHAIRHGEYRQQHWLTRFHKHIQWCERRWGVYFELCWLVLVGAGVRALIN